ncbi:hypothetical protein ADEAN_000698700 [Angomonas deanei]|uniref:Uncharacterized protein n=1 Tax=Angomonas deanei TaxID=59799 RepID=A0A7G2CHY9_9TRYP|nr:hypothetical protein ADEAN_000698700 [Angomonas deanei]
MVAFTQKKPTHDRRLIPSYEALEWQPPRELPGTAYGPRDLYNLKQLDRGLPDSSLDGSSSAPSQTSSRRHGRRNTAGMNKFINKTTTSWVSTNTKTTVVLPSASMRIIPDNYFENNQNNNNNNTYYYVSNEHGDYQDRVEVLPDNSYSNTRVPTPPVLSAPSHHNNNNSRSFLPSINSPSHNNNKLYGSYNNNNKMSAADYAQLDQRLNSTPRDTGVAEYLEL